MTTRNDRELDDLLGDKAGRIGASYRKLGKPEPPRRLDRNVLAEASRAVHGRPRSSRWLLGVGTAAGILLAAGIAWRVNHDMSLQRESAPASSPTSSPTADEATSQVIHVAPHVSEAESESHYSAEQRSGSLAGESDKPGSLKVEGVGPTEQKAAQTKRKLKAELAPDRARGKPSSEPAAAATQERAQLSKQSPAPPPPTPASAQPPARVEAAQTANPSPEPGNDAADSVASPMQESERPASSSSSTSNTAMLEIDRIRALLRAGKRSQALDALRELRRQQPALILPADLRALDG